jgi:thymidylate synthase (FAD)
MNKIYYPLNDNIGSVQLVDSVGDDTGIVNSARVSFGKKIDSIEDKDRKLIKYLLEHEHGTPFEHNSLTFLVKAPIFVARQWFRHRIASFNEISGRYVEVKEEFYIPQNFRKQSENNRQASVDEYVDNIERYDPNSPKANQSNQYGCFMHSPKALVREHYEASFTLYQELLSAGVCREQARAVLPLATYTEYYFTCNLRALLHFIKLRDHDGAQWEIQQYAKILKEIAKNIFPETFKIIENGNKI